MKKIIAVVTCCMLAFALGISAMAADSQSLPNIYDYESYGDLIKDLEPEMFMILDEDYQKDLYEISIEDMVNTENSTAEGNLYTGETSDLTKSTQFTLCNINAYSTIKGRVRVVADAEASAKCSSIGIVGIVYDSKGNVVERETKVKKNTTVNALTFYADDMTSSTTATAYATYRVIYPAGSVPSAETLSASCKVKVK